MADKKHPTLQQKLEASQLEEWQRGKEMAKLSRIITDHRHILPETFLAKVQPVIKRYNVRCTG